MNGDYVVYLWTTSAALFYSILTLILKFSTVLKVPPLSYGKSTIIFKECHWVSDPGAYYSGKANEGGGEERHNLKKGVKILNSFQQEFNSWLCGGAVVEKL